MTCPSLATGFSLHLQLFLVGLEFFFLSVALFSHPILDLFSPGDFLHFLAFQTVLGTRLPNPYFLRLVPVAFQLNSHLTHLFLAPIGIVVSITTLCQLLTLCHFLQLVSWPSWRSCHSPAIHRTHIPIIVVACHWSLHLFLIESFLFSFSFRLIQYQDSYRRFSLTLLWSDCCWWNPPCNMASIDIWHYVVFIVFIAIIVPIHEVYSLAESSPFSTFLFSVLFLLIAHFLQIALSSTVIAHNNRSFASF